MDTILKVEREGDLRRALLTGTPGYADVERAVMELWPGHSMAEAKYVDEEGDLCSVTEHTMSDFMVTAKTSSHGKSILRLQLTPAPPIDGACSIGVGVSREPFSEPWQHVEQGSEAGSECLHTVADLTDAHEPRRPELDIALESEAQESAEEFPIHTPVNGGSGEVIRGDELLNRLETVQTEFVIGAENTNNIGHASTGEVTEAIVIDHDADEQIDLIVVAFDENGDGHLNFKEFNALHRASWGGEIPFDAYRRMCLNEGEDVNIGVGREALMCIYSRSRDLEKDFEAAKRKLDGTEEEEERRSSQNSQANPINLMFKNPLLAVPFALDATERVRQRVVSQLSFKK